MTSSAKNIFTNPAAKALLVLFVLLLADLIFLNSQLVWDDETILKLHDQWSWKAMVGPYVYPPMYWRPLAVLSIAVPHMFGCPVWAIKLTGLVLFFIQGALAITVADRWMQSVAANAKSVALIILAMLIALHSVFVETAFWISARADLLLGLFIMLGLFWIQTALRRQSSAAQPENSRMALLRGFSLVWLACASKDTGLIWVLLTMPFVVHFMLNSTDSWRRFWRDWLTGMIVAVISYLVIRYFALHDSTPYIDNFAPRNMPLIEHVKIFLDFCAHTLIDIGLPQFDLTPFKDTGWFESFSVPVLIVLAVLMLLITVAALRWFFAVARRGAWLVAIALCPVLIVGLLTSVADITQGSIIATRYLAPSAMLFFIACCLALSKADQVPATMQGNASPGNAIGSMLHKPMLYICVALVAQSLFGWVQPRIAWSSERTLWESAWDLGSRSQFVVVNHAMSQLSAGHPDVARKVTGDWMARNQANFQPKPMCRMYSIAIQADMKMNDMTDAQKLATDAAPIAACNPALAQNVGYLLMKDHCDTSAKLINAALAEGDKPAGIGDWRFESPEQREQYLAYSAYLEARCGSDDNALKRLNELSTYNRDWLPDGARGKGLIATAHHDRDQATQAR